MDSVFGQWINHPATSNMIILSSLKKGYIVLTSILREIVPGFEIDLINRHKILIRHQSVKAFGL